VIEVMKEEAAKRSAGRDAADDNDKRKWMSTAQLWVDADADPVPVRFPSIIISVFIARSIRFDLLFVVSIRCNIHCPSRISNPDTHF
jgi:hypothetical protein